MKRILVLVSCLVLGNLANASDLAQWQLAWEAYDAAVEAADLEAAEQDEEVRPWRCVARDQAEENHVAGHSAVAADYDSARWDGYAQCRQFHRDCTVTCYRE